MKKINKSKIKIKNLIGIIDYPTYEDLLFEIVSFLEDEQKVEFNKGETSLKTRCRIGETLDEDLKVLVDLGYIEHQGWTKYKLLKQPW